MPDLFHIQRPVRKQNRSAGLFQHLQRIQQQKHCPVVNGKRSRITGSPRAVFIPPFKERVFIRIKNRTTQSRQTQFFVFNTGINCPEYRKQSRPRIVAAFQNFCAVFIGFFSQLRPQSRYSVMSIIYFAAQQKQTTFFCTKNKDQTHHYRKTGFIKFSRFYIPQQFSVAVFIGFIQTLNQHFNRSSHLRSQSVGNFFKAIQ